MFVNELQLPRGRKVKLCINSKCCYCQNTGIGHLCTVAGCIRQTNATAKYELIWQEVRPIGKKVHLRVDMETFDKKETAQTLKRLYKCDSIILLELVGD